MPKAFSATQYSILKIKDIKQITCFSFHSASEEKIKKEIPNIDSSKAIQKFDIPTKLIKGSGNFFFEVFI